MNMPSWEHLAVGDCEVKHLDPRGHTFIYTINVIQLCYELGIKSKYEYEKKRK